MSQPRTINFSWPSFSTVNLVTPHFSGREKKPQTPNPKPTKIDNTTKGSNTKHTKQTMTTAMERKATAVPPTSEQDDTSISVESSATDDRKYKIVELPNKLTALLISDPTSEKASAAMDVRVGHLSDPDDAPGLAHFLEHMLFMGTEKYPDENDYSVYLSTHGGSSNAFTDMESTNYYFDVSSDHLDGALDRFAQFFIAPLFNTESTEKELQAVDSEHAKNLQSDVWRAFQLSKSLCRDHHPFSKFGSGNLKTLKEDPMEKGLDIRSMLLDFHRTYYSANVMKLVVLGKESLDELENVIDKYFATVSNQNIETPSFPGQPFGPEQLSKRLSIVPVKDGVRCLDIHFPTREIDSLYMCKPTRYISHLIGHEGTGSLLQLLREKGWANELSAGESRSCTDWSCFTISIDLTDIGVDNIDGIVDVVFGYIALLRTEGVKKWIHDETATVADCSFRFLSKRSPMGYTCSLAGAMQIYPGQHILSGAYRIYDYGPKYIEEIISDFTAENMMIAVTSKTFEGKTDKKEFWYGTDYSIDDLSSDLCSKWNGMEPDVALHLPEMNDMIASEFSLSSGGDFPKDEPRLLVDDEKVKLWFKPDNVFDMPKVNVIALFRTTEASCSSPLCSVMSLLWASILQEHTTEFTYLASMANLHCSARHIQRGIELNLSGYNHKASILLKRMTKAMNEVSNKAEPKLFDRVKEKIVNQFQNFLFQDPYQHAFYAADLCLESCKWSIEDKMSALDSITIESFMDFSKNLLSRFHLEVLVHGNVSKDEAISYSEMIMEEMNPAAPFASTIPEIRVLQLEQGREYLHRFKEPNVNNTNSCIKVIFQVGQIKFKVNAMLAFLHHLIREPAFNELRTNEQVSNV